LRLVVFAGAVKSGGLGAEPMRLEQIAIASGRGPDLADADLVVASSVAWESGADVHAKHGTRLRHDANDFSSLLPALGVELGDERASRIAQVHGDVDAALLDNEVGIFAGVQRELIGVRLAAGDLA